MALFESKIPSVNICLLLLTLLLISSSASCDEQRVSGAGAVLYTTLQGKDFVLLADHRGLARGWAAFGGGLDNEEPLIAAAREVEEETNGVLKRSDLLDKLSSANYYRQSEGSWQFTTYFLKINFRESAEFTLSDNHTQIQAYNERGPYTWLPAAELTAAVRRYQNGERKINLPEKYLPPSSANKYYWDVFLKSIDEALNRGVVS